MRKIKILIILVISFILINCVNIKNIYATDEKIINLGISISDITEKAKQFEDAGSKNPVITEEKAKSEFLPVGQILVVIANAVVVIVVAIMGIKWLTANPEQQGKLKQQLIGLVVSIVVIYGAVGIWSFVKDILEK